VAGDHLGLGGIDTLEQLADVKRIPIEVASDCVVLNADDDLCVRMASHATAKRICYVTMNPSNVLVREHIRAGGMAVALENGVNGQMISVFDKGAHVPLLWTPLIPATVEGKAAHNVQNAMFAAGMAFAMNVKLDDIRQGLRTFDTTYFQAPGRMNIYDQLGFKVILDYGHNPHALEAMCKLVDNLCEGGGQSALRGKRVVVLAVPGDRRDEDAVAVVSRAARSFDHFILRQDDDRRGRREGELPELMARELRALGVSDDRITLIPDEQTAVDHALKLCRAGDLLLVFGDKISRTWKQIIYFGGRTGGPEAAPSDAARAVPVVAEDPQPIDLSSLVGQVVRDQRGVVLVSSKVEEAD
jgi:cyanophycin synthetase